MEQTLYQRGMPEVDDKPYNAIVLAAKPVTLQLYIETRVMVALNLLGFSPLEHVTFNQQIYHIHVAPGAISRHLDLSSTSPLAFLEEYRDTYRRIR